MPSGQRRVYEPYYYYDLESKSACVELHIRVVLIVLTELFSACVRFTRAPDHSYGIPSGFGCQERFRLGCPLRFLVKLVVTVVFLQATSVALAPCSGAMACRGRATGIYGTVYVTIYYGRSSRIP